MGHIYGYCRISRREQSIDRQIRNIKAIYPEAVIVQEAYTGTTLDRPKWDRLFKMAASGDTIAFDSVSRMSRTAEDGVQAYMDLYGRGVKLVFLREPYIDSETYSKSLAPRVSMTGTDVDEILKGINAYFKKLAASQIRIAFEQAEKEVLDLHQRTREGIETARLKGKQIGQRKGARLHVKKAVAAKKKILECSRAFNGSLSDKDCMKVCGISRNSFYKYKKQLKEKAAAEALG